MLTTIILSLLFYTTYSGDYIYSSAARTWDQAKTFCNSYQGLATIITSADVQQARNRAGGNCWIGLKDVNQNNNWRWDDGTPCTITTGHHCSDWWGSSEPNSIPEQCVEFVDNSGTFNDKDCGTSSGIGTLCNIPSSSPTPAPTNIPTISPTLYPTINPTTLLPTNAPSTDIPTFQPTSDPTIDGKRYEITYGVVISIYFQYELQSNMTNNSTKRDLKTLMENTTRKIINEILNEQNLTYCILSDDYEISINETIENNISSTSVISSVFFCEKYRENILFVDYVGEKLDTDFINQLNESDLLIVKPDSVNIDVDLIAVKGNEIKVDISTTNVVITNSMGTDEKFGENVIEDDMIIVYIVIAIGLVIIALTVVVFIKKYRGKKKFVTETVDNVIMMQKNRSNLNISPSMNSVNVTSKATESVEPNTDDINMNDDDDDDTDLYDTNQDEDMDDVKETMGNIVGSIYDKPISVEMTRGIHRKSIDDDMYDNCSDIKSTPTQNSGITTSKGN